MAPVYCVVKLFERDHRNRITNAALDPTVPQPANPTVQPSQEESPAQISTTCRICLKEGAIPIFNDQGTSDISDEIQVIADISISKDDNYPQHICESCQMLLQAGILFRELAKKSMKILDNSLKHAYPDDNKDDSKNTQKREKKSKDSAPILENYFLNVERDDQGNVFNIKPGEVDLLKSPKLQCQICFKVVSKSYYKEHFSLHDVTPVRYMCDVCGKSFRLRSAYRNHMFTHSREFPYKCQICSYRGRHSGLLKTHMKTHIKDYKHKCSQCPATFIFKSNLNRHMLTHKDPMFQCSSCKRTFHSKLLMDRHFEVEHLGIRKHICNECGKAFGYRRAMMRHQLDVHKREKQISGRTPTYLQAEYQEQDS